MTPRRGAGREGVTTGSCAAAAAKAATLRLCTGVAPPRIDIPCPPTPHAHPERLQLPVADCRPEGQAVRATIIKDAGDDPDVTHGCAVQALVWQDATLPAGTVRIDGGLGVGRVTRPGLPVPVGQAAINPAPLAQIEAAVREGLAILAGLDGLDRQDPRPALQVRIEIPDGIRLAEKTLNPRLGVVGGLSILGTRGTVRPFSHASWKQTLRSQFDVLTRMEVRQAVLSTGGRSEHLCRQTLPALPEAAFLQIGDYLAFALHQAARHGMLGVVLGMYFGKCCKLAQGIGFTHARAGALELSPLPRWCAAAGLDQAAAVLNTAHTARQAMELLDDCAQGPAALDLVARRALAQAQRMAGCTPRGENPAVTLLLFDTTNALRLRRSTQDR